VARVSLVQKVSFAEAVKKLEEDGSRVRDPERMTVSRRSVPAQSVAGLGFSIYVLRLELNTYNTLAHRAHRLVSLH
jgi:hypothetical protein